jgi:hypothetical protein
LRLSPATTKYTLTRGIPVPMRDCVGLLDHYAPTTYLPGVILVFRYYRVTSGACVPWYLGHQPTTR